MAKAWSLWPMLAAFLLFSLLAMYIARRFREVSVARHPVICMLALLGLIVMLVRSVVLNDVTEARLWTFIAIFAAYFWFLCYALVDQRRTAAWTPIVQLGVFHPFWGSYSIPIGKGAEYLRKVEAMNPRDLAITQIKGLKLLAWVHVLTLLRYLLEPRQQRAPGVVRSILQGLSQTLVLAKSLKSIRRKRSVAGRRLQIAMAEWTPSVRRS